MVDGPAQRLPAQRGVGAVEIGEEVFRIERRPDSRVVVPACVRPAEVDVGRFSEIAVEPQMTDDANVLAAVGGENLIGITPINLGCSLEEPVLGRRQKPRKRSEEHTSELQSRLHLVCRLLLEKKKKISHRMKFFKISFNLIIPARVCVSVLIV